MASCVWSLSFQEVVLFIGSGPFRKQSDAGRLGSDGQALTFYSMAWGPDPSLLPDCRCNEAHHMLLLSCFSLDETHISSLTVSQKKPFFKKIKKLFTVCPSALVTIKQLQASVLCLYHMGLGDHSQVISLAIKCLYPLSHLVSTFFKLLSPAILSQ